MIFRLAAILALVGGLVFTGGLSTSNTAQAAMERVYDFTEMRWKMVDTNRRKYTRKKPPAKFNKRNVSINTNLTPGTVVIHTDEKFLYYITSNKKAVRYGVGVGREGFTWNGTVKIKRKVEWPTWTPPPEMRARERAEGRILPISMKGGIDNPLGARALYLYQGGRDTLYRIHGTNQPWSIGLNLSSGCIRMMNQDVEDLYDRVNLGTKVVVVGPGQDASKYLRENKNPFAALFGG